MSKSNNKKSRTNGTINSGNIEFPNPITSKNTSLGNFDFTDKMRNERNSKQNNKY